jgi:exodeoxyribonuclease V alpha subunit
VAKNRFSSLMSQLVKDQETIFGHIERVTYQNEDTGYTVAHIALKGYKDPVCVVGSMPLVQPGEMVRCMGEWTTHCVYGKQFSIAECSISAPADVLGIKKYLGSGLVKGIGPAAAGKIVDHFGSATLEVIDKTPERLLEISGIGKKKADLIIACWTEQRSVRDVMLFLQSHGISPAYAQKIFKAYGQNSIKVVKENPYCLAREIHGIGFTTADKLAKTLGHLDDAPFRIDAGIEYALSQLSSEGHVCSPLGHLLDVAEKLLNCEKEKIGERLTALKQEERIAMEELIFEGKAQAFVWLKSFYISERGIASELRRIRKGTLALRTIDCEKALDWVQKTLHIELASKQKEAVKAALQEKVVIITGGPGTGKSTITNAILAIMGKLTGKILLAAPTGRAAKRMSEITQKKASTIHSLLEFDFKGGFKRRRDNPLDADFIIVDESSMIDTLLMYSLLKAIPDRARLILVGDINQLPSVGPGNVLRDLILAGCLPVVTLNEIFRQAKGSLIVTNAHKINEGTFPTLDNKPDSDFFFFSAEEPELVRDNILSLVACKLPQKYKFDAMRDIQVLTPMKKGIIGADNMNEELRRVLNKNSPQQIKGMIHFALGDKVIQLRNDYQKCVFNGDIGWITAIDVEEQEFIVAFDEREVVYEFREADQLMLAYAISVHKSQGSETPCVVIPIHTTHFKMLLRNLLYTAITRGKKVVVLVGSKKAIALCVRNDEVRRRYTGLQEALLTLGHPAIHRLPE